MSCKKLSWTTRVTTVSVNGRATTLAFTSDAIPLAGSSSVTINFFFDSLTTSGPNKNPTLTIEESNSTDADSFVAVSGWVDVPLPEFFKDFKSEAEYIRYIYDPEDASGGTIEVQTRLIK